MICSGTCFVLSVLTFYSFYRFLLQQNEFFEESSKVHLNRCAFFSAYMTAVIYQGSLTGIQVSFIFEFQVLDYRLLHYLFDWQGKKTSKLVHSIINTCYDTEIVQSVCLLMFSCVVWLFEINISIVNFHNSLTSCVIKFPINTQ